jgi:hypothetical protein
MRWKISIGIIRDISGYLQAVAGASRRLRNWPDDEVVRENVEMRKGLAAEDFRISRGSSRRPSIIFKQTINCLSFLASCDTHSLYLVFLGPVRFYCG